MHSRTLVTVNIPEVEPDIKTDQEIQESIKNIEIAMERCDKGNIGQSVMKKLCLSRYKGISNTFAREIYNAVDELLEPYCESTENPDYLEFEDHTDELKDEYENKSVDCIKLPGGRIVSIHNSIVCGKYTVHNGLVYQKRFGQLKNEKRSKSANNDWTFVNEQRGILIPVCDEHRKIQAMQIRRDNVQKRKFRWFSSVDRKDGRHAEGWTHIAGPIRSLMLITEGPMKADIIHELSGHSVIAVPGVNSLTQLKDTIIRLRELGIRELMTAFDMDYLTNPNVQKAFADLSSLLGEIDIPFGTYLWNPEYKGLDDYMHAFLMRYQ